MGHYGCFSFFPSKNLGGGGDGGMVVVRDARARRSAPRASRPRLETQVLPLPAGGNFRLDTIQAAIVHAKLRHLDDWTAARQANAQRYERLFREAGLVDRGLVGLPHVLPDVRHIFNQFVIRVPDRDGLRAFLQQRGVGLGGLLSGPAASATVLPRARLRRGLFPRKREGRPRTLALPIYPELSPQQASCVVESIAEWAKQRS